VVWEVLADDSPAQLIFVSRNLEAAAQAQFGKPLPGRRFAVERSLEEAPRTIVGRVLDDTAAPMGPIVYLRAGTRAVSTVICRCMASQAKGVLASITYDLRAAQTAPTQALLAAVVAQAKGSAPSWPEEGPAVTNRLDQCLRLPADF
jgi:hypothetical protein